VGPWGSEQLKAADLTGRYGMGKNTAYKLLADPPRWLGVEKVPGEGYRLTIRPETVLTSRALDLLLDEPERKNFIFSGIAAPELVQKGERNRWLVSLILVSKWSGIGQKEVRKALELVIRRVPGWQKSQSLTSGLGATLRSLYRNRSSLKGRNVSQEQPSFWVEALESLKIREISSKKHKKASLDAMLPGRNPELIPERDPEARVLPFQASSSPIPVEVRPGVRGGPGPWIGGETRIPDATASPVFSAEVHTGQPEIYLAGRAVAVPPAAAPDAEPASDAESGDGLSDVHPGCHAFAHLSGSALSSAFSKALMKSARPAAEKARILTEVTRVTNLTQKERARRDWLAKLT
ncbi:MAG: hypothetical protein M3Q07_26420, partial [Pseudobdellovibrionaceae bacterium]|nr:hypothetical protein [Pseudobdellovibrionaceae bacterium]